MPVVEVATLAGGTLKVEVAPDETVAGLVRSVSTGAFEDSVADAKFLGFLQSVPDVLCYFSLLRGETRLMADEQVCDSNSPGPLSAVMKVDEHPSLACVGTRAQGLQFSRAMEVLTAACDLNGDAPPYLTRDGPFRADAAICLSSYVEEHEMETVKSVLELLALLADSKELLHHVLNHREELENLHQFVVKNRGWLEPSMLHHLEGQQQVSHELLEPHVSLAWAAAYFGSPNVFEMLTSSAAFDFPALTAIDYGIGYTFLQFLVDQCSRGLGDQQLARGLADSCQKIMKVVLDRRDAHTEWVVTYAEELCSPDGERTFCTVLHHALGFVGSPRLCYDWCKVLICSRFGHALIGTKFKSYVEGEYDDDYNYNVVQRTDELDTFQYLEQQMRYWPDGWDDLKVSLRALFAQCIDDDMAREPLQRR